MSGDGPLPFKYLAVPTGGKPYVPVRFTASAGATVFAASLAPSLPRTIVSPLWAAGIGLSVGATVVAQVQESMSLTSPTWGPQEILVPVHSPDLDEVGSVYADEEADDVDWRAARDWCLLGHDFLRNLTVILDGRNGRLVLDIS